MANTRKQRFSEQTEYTHTIPNFTNKSMVEDSEISDTQQVPEYTIWFNPKDFPAKLRLQTWSVSPRYIQENADSPRERWIPVGPGYNGNFRDITIPPGSSYKIESVYDQTIRKQDANGQIVGGDCPWLLKEGETEVNISEALDFELALEVDKLNKATKKLIKQNILTEKQAEYNAKKQQIQEARKQIAQDSNLGKK